jgi:hypothetical protein
MRRRRGKGEEEGRGGRSHAAVAVQGIRAREDTAIFFPEEVGTTSLRLDTTLA